MKSLLLLLLCCLFSQAYAEGIEAPTIEGKQWVLDHLEVQLVFAGEGDLSLSILKNTCPAQIAQQITLPSSTILSVSPKGEATCSLLLSASNDFGDDAKWQLEIGEIGKTGIQVSLKLTANRDLNNTPAWGGNGTLELHGGWGQLSLDGLLRVDSSLSTDQYFRVGYFGFSALLANGNGAPAHPAGDAGRGLYAAQRFDTPLGVFAVGVGAPLGLPARAGLAYRSPSVCAQASLNSQLQDPILGLQLGYAGARADFKYRPAATERFSFGLEYQNSDWLLALRGNETRIGLEVKGFSLQTPLGWLLLESQNGYSSTGFSSTGNIKTAALGLKWAYNTSPFIELEYRLLELPILSSLRLFANISFAATPGFLGLEALYSDFDQLELRVLGTVNTAFVVSLSGKASYSFWLEGRWKVGAGIEAADVRLRSNYYATASLSYGHPSGWQIGIEWSTQVFRPSQWVLSLSVGQWSYIGITPPLPEVQLLAANSNPSRVAMISPCSGSF